MKYFLILLIILLSIFCYMMGHAFRLLAEAIRAKNQGNLSEHVVDYWHRTITYYMLVVIGLSIMTLIAVVKV